MKIGTILGVLAAAAAVAAIAIAAPARAEVGAVKPARSVAVAREAAAERPGIGTPAWLLMLTGFVGLGAMLRAARPAFQD